MTPAEAKIIPTMLNLRSKYEFKKTPKQIGTCHNTQNQYHALNFNRHKKFLYLKPGNYQQNYSFLMSTCSALQHGKSA